MLRMNPPATPPAAGDHEGRPYYATDECSGLLGPSIVGATLVVARCVVARCGDRPTTAPLVYTHPLLEVL